MVWTADTLAELVARAGLLGTAAMALVEAAKFTPLGRAGLGRIREALGDAGMKALAQAYGERSLGAVLAGSFRRGHLELADVLRNGLRLGLTSDDAPELAKQFGQEPGRLVAALAIPTGAGASPGDEAVAALARFHAAIDARVDAAVASAHETYLGTLRVTGTLLALAGSLGVALVTGQDLWLALGIGLVAVPVAPISKEALNLLRAAALAVRRLG
jgi:hypothetical protein